MNRLLFSGFPVVIFMTMFSCVSTQEGHEAEVSKDTGTKETKEIPLEEMANLVDSLEGNDDAAKNSWPGHESTGIIRYLMSIENPSSEIIDAVQGAVAWFDKNSISGIKYIEIDAPELPAGRDRIVVEDPSAPPIRARFYDIETSKPFFLQNRSEK